MEKKRYLELIWTDFVQVYTNINYSSLYSEKLRENQKGVYFWGIYACFGIPPILGLVVKRYAISNDLLFYGVIALILLLPLAVRIKKIEFFQWDAIDARLKRLTESPYILTDDEVVEMIRTISTYK